MIHSPIYAGEVISITSNGEEEWRSPKRQQVQGSYEKTISVKSVGGDGQGQSTHIQVSGNPSKFLQGHNVFGSDDLVSLVYDTYRVICRHFRLQPTLQNMSDVRSGNYELTTVDINFSYELPSKSDVLAFIRALEFKAKTRHGRPTTKGGTLYFGKNSQRWAIKFYCKAEEIKTSRGALPEELKKTQISSWAENKLRIELRLLSKQLKQLDILKASHLPISKVKELFNEYVSKIDMSEQIQLTDDVIASLPNKLKSTYTLWSEGHDLRSMMSSATYKRHRKELRAYNINVDLKPESTQKTIVVPLIRVIEAKPAQVPHWAFSEKLVHHSASI